MAPTAPTTDSVVSDPFLLSWGSSVNVCDDLRRSLRTECEELDSNIISLQGNVKNEDRTSTQLAKDLSHSRSEMVDLRRSIADVLDNATMREQVRIRLKASLKAELLTPLSVVDPKSSHSMNGSSSSVDNTNGTPPATIAEYFQQCAAELKDVAVSIANEEESWMELKAIRDDLDGEAQATVGRIEADNLEAELEVLTKETAVRKDENENEARRKRSTKATVQQVRAQCGHHAQQIADHTKTLTAKKAKNDAKQAELALQVKQIEQLRSSSSKAELDSRFDTVSTQLTTLKRQLEAHEAMRKARDQSKAEYEALEKENEQYVKSMKGLEAAVRDAQSKHEASLAVLQEERKVHVAVMADRITNDKMHAEMIVPGQVEKNAIMEEKQALASKMNQFHETSVSHEKEHGRELADQSETLKKLDGEHKRMLDELAEKRASEESIKRAKEEANGAAKKELEEHNDYHAKFEEAAAAESERIVELELEHNRNRRERVEDARIESSRMRSELERKLEVLRLGADLIADVNKLTAANA